MVGWTDSRLLTWSHQQLWSSFLFLGIYLSVTLSLVQHSAHVSVQETEFWHKFYHKIASLISCAIHSCVSGTQQQTCPSSWQGDVTSQPHLTREEWGRPALRPNHSGKKIPWKDNIPTCKSKFSASLFWICTPTPHASTQKYYQATIFPHTVIVFQKEKFLLVSSFYLGSYCFVLASVLDYLFKQVINS